MRALDTGGRIDRVADVFRSDFFERIEQALLGGGRPDPQDVGVFGRADLAMESDGMATHHDERHVMPPKHFEDTELRSHRYLLPLSDRLIWRRSCGAENGRGPRDGSRGSPATALTAAASPRSAPRGSSGEPGPAVGGRVPRAGWRRNRSFRHSCTESTLRNG